MTNELPGDEASGLPPALTEALRRAAPNGLVTIAYSGGLDSRFLAFAAKRAGFQVRLLHVRGPHIASSETREAVDGARELGLEAELFDIDPLKLPALAGAGRERCYVCKTGLFTELLRIAGSEPLCDGTNHSDLSGYRPGRRALLELGIHSPLEEAGLSKPDIRALAARLGMSRPDQAARPCLLTRFPYGALPSAEQLRLTAEAEDFVSSHPSGARLRFRLRFPDGVTPELHVDTAFAEGLSAQDLDRLTDGLRAAFRPKLDALVLKKLATLSGYYDRTP
ncbi:MAG: ATP-dependent sacrificial sulfur transferase LarE [Sutterella sp.]|nr:ATP-dependent sacrificial sulfur transferase LarE [Sutterella sp.]